jgi:8-oxo-dGTP diphosphatase
MAEAAILPVYALGGLDEAHLARAKQAGAQGVAAIRGFIQ